MAKHFYTLLFSFFLLFQTTVIADEDNTSTEIVEENEAYEESQSTEEENIDEQEQEAQEELSELEKEALEAEAAELREAGVYDEPVEE